MKKKWRILLISLLVIGLLGILGIEYLNEVVMPVKARAWATKTLSQMLGRSVSIGRVRLHPWHGVIIEGVVIWEDRAFADTPFVQIERIRAKVLYLPLFKKREIIIPTIYLDHPHLRLLQNPQGVWNFQSLQLKSAATGTGPSKFQLLIPKVVVTDGQLEVLSYKLPLPVLFRFSPFNADIGLQLPSSVQWNINTKLSSISQSEIKISGYYDFNLKRWSIQNQATLPLEILTEYLPAKTPLPIKNLQGTSWLNAEMEGPAQGPFKIKGEFKTAGLSVAMTQPFHTQEKGDFHLNFSGQWPGPPGPDPWAGWQGDLQFEKLLFLSVPYLKEVQEVAGQVQITSKEFRSSGIDFQLPNGEKFQMSGSVANNAGHALSLLIKTNLNLSKIPGIPEHLKQFVEKFEPAGAAALDINLEGSLNPIHIRPTVNGVLQGAAAKLMNFGVVSDVGGRFRWQLELLTVSGLKGKLQGQPLELEGSMAGFLEPEIDARFRWGRLEGETRLTVDGQHAQIQNLSGTYGPTRLRVIGELQWGQEFIGNLYGETHFKIEDLPSLIPNPPPALTHLQTKGEMDVRWTAEGPLTRPADLALSLKMTSNQIRYRSIPFEQVSVDARQERRNWTLKNATARFAGGSLSLQGICTNADSTRPWTAEFKAAGVELAELSKNLNWQMQDLQGQLDLDWKGKGSLASWGALQGNGNIQIQGARILELPLLGRFADLLNLPGLKTIVLQEGRGPFSIQGGAVKTEAIQLKAPQLTLTIAGSGGFLDGADSPINWRVLPMLSGELVPEESRSKLGRAIAQGTSYLIGEIRITGTWKDPKRAFVPKPITQILNEQLFNLQDLLKDLF